MVLRNSNSNINSWFSMPAWRLVLFCFFAFFFFSFTPPAFTVFCHVDAGETSIGIGDDQVQGQSNCSRPGERAVPLLSYSR